MINLKWFEQVKPLQTSVKTTINVCTHYMINLKYYKQVESHTHHILSYTLIVVFTEV